MIWCPVLPLWQSWSSDVSSNIRHWIIDQQCLFEAHDRTVCFHQNELEGRDCHVANIKVLYAIVSGDLRVKHPSQNPSLLSSLQRKHRGPRTSVMSPLQTWKKLQGLVVTMSRPKVCSRITPNGRNLTNRGVVAFVGRGNMENSP